LLKRLPGFTLNSFNLLQVKDYPTHKNECILIDPSARHTKEVKDTKDISVKVMYWQQRQADLYRLIQIALIPFDDKSNYVVVMEITPKPNSPSGFRCDVETVQALHMLDLHTIFEDHEKVALQLKNRSSSSLIEGARREYKARGMEGTDSIVPYKLVFKFLWDSKPQRLSIVYFRVRYDPSITIAD
jgi:hypothetical protein